MPTVTPDDVADAIRTAWAAATPLDALIPAAGVYRDRAAEGTAPPYAALKIEEGRRELFSGSAYVQPYTATVEAYTAADPPNAGAVRLALDVTFVGTAGNPNAGLAVANGKVVHSRGAPGGEARPSQVRLDGKDVVKVVARYELLVQGGR